jgi:adenylate kinase
MITLLVGPPGAGKGTQADLLVEKCGFRKLSTGDVLRKHIRNRTEIGLLAADVMAGGGLVSDEILFKVLKEELYSSTSSRVLLDGYPRNISQAGTLASLDGIVVGCAIHIDVQRSELIDRLSGRRTCSSCSSTFHTRSNKPKRDGICNKCGGELVQRPDDVADKVAVRLDVYDTVTKPVLDYYRKLGLYERVEGTGDTDSVYQKLRVVLKSKLDIDC